MIQHSLAFTSATTTRILLSNARKNNQTKPLWFPLRGGVFENGRRLIDGERCLLNRESTMAGAFFSMCGVVEFIWHRTRDYAFAQRSASLFLRGPRLEVCPRDILFWTAPIS